MPNLSVDLTKEMIDLLDGMVATGQYVDRGEALRGILRAIIRARAAEKASTGGGDTGGTVTIQMRVIDPF